MMATIHVSLPDAMREFVEQETGRGNYSTVSEYIRSLLRQEERRLARAKLEGELLAGLESPVSDVGPGDWQAIGEEARARVESKK